MSRRLAAVALEGVRHLLRSPLRSLLSAGTSAVAIAVTVNVISLSFGMEEDIRRDVDLFGRRTVDVVRLPVLLPGARRPQLGLEEERKIREQLKWLEPFIVPRGQAIATATGQGAQARAGSDRVSVVGAPPAYLETLSIPVGAGRWLKAGDPDGRGAEGVCVLDAAQADRLFALGRPGDAVDRRLELVVEGGKRTYRVVGVLSDPLRYRSLFEAFDEGRGARTLTSSLLSFRNIYVPDSALSGKEFTGISIALPDVASVEEARHRLHRIWSPNMGDPKGLLTGAVGVFVRRDWMDALGAANRQGAQIGNLVWIIVVLVAVIMISTLNLITIRERYDEIALRRCEGARGRDVALQVTVEGTLTALVGGLAGLPIGWAGAYALREIVEFPFRFEARYALAATGVAVLLGLLASVIPALNAARLQPARVLGRRLR